jgi:predicted DNA-binding WGR domain protein
MNAAAPDFRNEEPTWVRYAEYVGGGSNKFYEARIDLGDDGLFWLTKRWGARPDAGGGQTKAEHYATLKSAIGAANEILEAKRRKGYRLTERPRGADNKVAHEYGADYYSDDQAF